MAITLDDVVLEQMQTNETLEKVEGALFRLDRNIDNFITLWYAQKLKEMEDMRERIAPEPEVLADNARPTEEDPSIGIGGLAGLAAALSGAVLGFAAGFADTLNSVLKLLKVDIGAKFAKWGRSLKALFSEESVIGKAIQSIKNGIGKVKTFFMSMGDFFKTEGAIGKVFTKIGQFFQPVINFVKGFGTTFSKFFGFFRILGRIFLPITAAIEVFTSLWKEFSAQGENSDIVDKFYALQKGLLKGLANIVLVPLDMLKDGISWLMEKMGFENFSKMLDSFSFSDTFGQVVDMIFNVMEAFARGATAAIGALMPGGLSPAEAFMKEWDHVMSGGEGGAPPKAEPVKGITSAGQEVDAPKENAYTRAQNRSRRARARAEGAIAVDEQGNAIPIEGANQDRATEAAMAQRDGVQSRLAESTPSTRQQLGEQLGEKSLDGAMPTVTVVNQNNVNAPTSNVSNTSVSGGNDIPTPSPINGNGSRADAYAMG
jgi:hypothetical protein